jgi:hypothetical protein
MQSNEDKITKTLRIWMHRNHQDELCEVVTLLKENAVKELIICDRLVFKELICDNSIPTILKIEEGLLGNTSINRIILKNISMKDMKLLKIFQHHPSLESIIIDYCRLDDEQYKQLMSLLPTLPRLIFFKMQDVIFAQDPNWNHNDCNNVTPREDHQIGQSSRSIMKFSRNINSLPPHSYRERMDNVQMYQEYRQLAEELIHIIINKTQIFHLGLEAPDIGQRDVFLPLLMDPKSPVRELSIGFVNSYKIDEFYFALCYNRTLFFFSESYSIHWHPKMLQMLIDENKTIMVIEGGSHRVDILTSSSWTRFKQEHNLMEKPLSQLPRPASQFNDSNDSTQSLEVIDDSLLLSNLQSVRHLFECNIQNYYNVILDAILFGTKNTQYKELVPSLRDLIYPICEYLDFCDLVTNPPTQKSISLFHDDDDNDDDVS